MSWQDKIRNPNCRLCPLHAEADHVCLLGTGPKKADIFIVGEAPGEREDEKHQAFVGPAGKLLEELLGEVGISRSECYLTNVAKCRPPENRQPDAKEIKTCVNTYLLEEFKKVSPRWVLLLGNSAIKGVVGKTGITKLRGTTFELGDDCTAMATFHPAYALRNPQHLEPIRADLQRFAALTRGEKDIATKTRTRVIRSRQGLRELRDRLLSVKGPLAWDLETNYNKERKEFYKPWEPSAAIIMISFSWVEGESWVVPLYHAQSPFRDSWREVLQYLKPAMERGKGEVKYVAHNGKYDCRWMAASRVFVRLDFDTMLGGHLLEENRAKALESLSSVLLGAKPWKFDLRQAYDMDLRKLAIYAGKDTDHTLRLYYRFREELKQNKRLARIFLKLMMPGSNVLTEVESVGMYLHVDRAIKVREELTKKRDKVLKKLRKHVPPYSRERINFNSVPQLSHWLFTDLGLPILARSKKTKNPSTAESVLLQLAAQHPAPKLLLEYRGYKGHLEKVTSWLEKADERGRVHTNYKLFGTVTGRLSSEDPNLQQVPREGIMRTCFGAPDGWAFVEADFSQVELRIAAMLSGDPTLRSVYLTGGDAHTKTASEVSGKAPGLLTKEERKKAKPVNFGFLYGMGSAKFTSYAFDNYGVKFSAAESEKVRNTFFETYPMLRPWHARQRRTVHRYGYVTSPIGRVRHLPNINSRDEGVRKDSERQAINSPVQSFASDLMLTAMVRLHYMLKAGEARIVGTVHDAILFEIRLDKLKKWLPVIKQTMEDVDVIRRWFGYDIDLPIVAEVSYGKYWGDPDAVVFEG